MPSTYSTDLKLELMVTGENAGTWGEKTNTNLNLVQQAIAGVQSIDVGPADVTLVMSNAALSNARNMVLNLTGSLTGARQVLIPNGIEKFYIIKDSTTRNGNSLTIKTVSGTGFAIETSGSMVACYSDGTDVTEISLNTLSGTIAGAQIDNLAISSSKLASFAVTAARLASFAVTTNKLSSFAVTTAKLATNAVTAIKITQSTITQSKLAANSVGANQLISTGVTAATYTSATITVDADGRITSASSGSAGAGMGIPVLAASGPASGTYTKNNAANRIGVYLYGGGGGGGASGCNSYGGGAGGYGFFNFPTTSPLSVPYSVGGGGTGNYPSPRVGNAGGATTLTNVGTANGGNGSPANAPGNSGNAPGAALVPNIRTLVVGTSFGSAGSYPGTPGGAGAIVIFENTGT